MVDMYVYYLDTLLFVVDNDNLLLFFSYLGKLANSMKMSKSQGYSGHNNSF